MIRAVIARADGRVLLYQKALLTLEGSPDFLEAARRLSALLGGEVVPLHRDAFYLFPNHAQRQVWVFESFEPLCVPLPLQWCGVEDLASSEERKFLELYLLETPAHRLAQRREKLGDRATAKRDRARDSKQLAWGVECGLERGWAQGVLQGATRRPDSRVEACTVTRQVFKRAARSDCD